MNKAQTEYPISYEDEVNEDSLEELFEYMEAKWKLYHHQEILRRMDTILLFSGGMDSLVSAGLLLEKSPEKVVTCVFFDYDQHTAEIEWKRSQQCIAHFPPERITLIRRRLTDYKEYVKGVSIVGGGHIPTKDEDPEGYFVPGRNIIFLLYAAILGYGHGCREIAYSPHKWVHAGDCLPEFREAITQAFHWGFSMERKTDPWLVWSPIGHLGKDEVVKEGTRLGLPLHLSWSCHDALEEQCGVCHNCDERQLAYRLAEIPDPTPYLNPPDVRRIHYRTGGLS